MNKLKLSSNKIFQLKLMLLRTNKLDNFFSHILSWQVFTNFLEKC